MKYDVQLKGEMFRMDPDPDEGRDSVAFGIHIEKCRPNHGLIGQTFTGPMATFPVVAQMAVTGTKAEDWK
jgi:hypothetical protein